MKTHNNQYNKYKINFRFLYTIMKKKLPNRESFRRSGATEESVLIPSQPLVKTNSLPRALGGKR